jgi:hypothetical protein
LNIDGRKVANFKDFIAAMDHAGRLQEPDCAGFGWDIHSFHDRLYGGFCGAPPYEIIVHNAEQMFESLDHAAAAAYYDDMVGIAKAGGRGSITFDMVDELVRLRSAAQSGCGPTLFMMIVEVVLSSPASILLESSRSTGAHNPTRGR